MKHLSPAEIETIRVPEPKHDPFSLESLVAWLERQDGSTAYDWENCEGGCLIGLYGLAVGLGEAWHKFHAQLFMESRLSIAAEQPHTFSAALTRARAALASQKGNANG